MGENRIYVLFVYLKSGLKNKNKWEVTSCEPPLDIILCLRRWRGHRTEHVPEKGHAPADAGSPVIIKTPVHIFDRPASPCRILRPGWARAEGPAGRVPVSYLVSCDLWLPFQ